MTTTTRRLRPGYNRQRGFATMTPEQKREIASKGGKAAHALGTAHTWTPEEAQEAGRKGGSVHGKNGTGRRAKSKSA